MHSTTLLAAALSMALSTEAHMLLTKPQMFPNTGAVTSGSYKFNNGPLNNGGGEASNYPCKSSGAGSYEYSFAPTQIPIGSNYSMELMGGAVHGGGSCQISLSKDLAPTKDSVFKVIHSIEGGCPARDTPGNLPGSAESPDPFQYSFAVPDGIEPGKYTFAWTWFNKLGNREMYMNCAPVEITGGSSHAKRDAASFDSLPDIFLANIPDVDCTTEPLLGGSDPKNLKFPKPGNSVEANVPDANLAPLPKECYAPPGKTSTGGGSGSAKAPAAAAPAPAPASSAAAPSPSAAAPTSAAAVVAPAPSSAAAPAPSAAAPATNVNAAVPATGSGACPAGQQACSGSAMVCASADHFGLCNNGCMLPQAVASGTQCVNGAIQRRSLFRLSAVARRALYALA